MCVCVCVCVCVCRWGVGVPRYMLSIMLSSRIKIARGVGIYLGPGHFLIYHAILKPLGTYIRTMWLFGF